MTDDDRLMERLRAIAELVDPPPEFVLDAARAALLTRRLDSELAELTGDSAAGAAGGSPDGATGGSASGFAGGSAAGADPAAYDHGSHRSHGDASDAFAVAREDSGRVRVLSFSCQEVAVELQVHPVGARFALRGLVSGATGHVTADTATGPRTAPVTPDGWFTLADLPPGPFRLRVPAGDSTVTTSWVTL
jgi:hypothetical protein